MSLKLCDTGQGRELKKMSQREERENNIARVIDVALGLFISDGIAATSINRIAKKSGLAPMSIYRYFGSKDMLVAQVWQNALNDFYRRYMEKYERMNLRDSSGYEKFVASMDVYFSAYSEFPQWYDYTREMFAYRFSGDTEGGEIYNVFWKYYDREIPIPALKALKEGVADGSIRKDVDIYAVYQVLLNAYTGTAIYENVSFGVKPVDVVRFTGNLIANYIKNPV